MANLLDGILSMGGNVNRVKEGTEAEVKEGAIGSLLPELTLNIDDDELIKISESWKESWEASNKTLRDKQDQNEKYWQGKFQYSELEQKSKDRPEADNILFESLETALPMFTRQNPEASIHCRNDDQKMFIQEELKTIADVLKLKLKIRDSVRNWSLFYLGVSKINWDVKNDRIDIKVLRPQKLILDPDACVEGGVYQGYYLGEYKTEKAKVIIKKFPNQTAYIKGLCKDKLDTAITYIEWWTDEYTFWTLGKVVLDKIKNPHWNYGDTKMVIDEFGQEVTQEIKGLNFLPYSQKPYSFLTVFNLGKHPFDDTSLFEQNLYLQDLIHKRLKQIDVNADNMNGGWVVSGQSGITSEQATTAINAIRKGGAIFTPGQAGGIQKISGDGLPGDVYQSLQDYRNELRNIYGVRGSSAQGVASEQTVRGKIIVGQKDDSRMGLIAEYIEQYVDYIYNWFVQMIYVYYPEEDKARLIDKMSVTVKEGSLIPDDSLTKRNEAIDLYTAGALSLKDLYKALEMPNPEEMEANLLAWKQAQIMPPPMAPGSELIPAENQTAQNLMAAALTV
jgi:hypothetical protein